MTDSSAGKPPQPLPRALRRTVPQQLPQAPPVPPSRKLPAASAQTNPSRVLLIVLSALGLFLIVVCSGMLVMGYAAVQFVKAERSRPVRLPTEEEERQLGNHGDLLLEHQSEPDSETPPTPYLAQQMPAPPQPTPERYLQMLKGSNGAEMLAAAEWFAQQPLDPARQSQVQHSLTLILSRKYGVYPPILAALKVWGDERMIPMLETFIEREPEHAALVVDLLVGLNHAEADAALVRMLRFRDPIKTAVADAFKQRGEASRSVLTPAVSDMNEQVRQHAATLLREIGISDDEIATDLLSQLESNTDWRYKNALAWYEKASLSPEASAKVMPAVAAFLRHEDYRKREAAMKLLVADQSAASSNVLLVAVEERPKLWHPALIELLNREDERLVPILSKRALAGGSLSFDGLKGGENVIIKVLMTCDDRKVLENVATNYRSVMTRKSVPALERVLKLATQHKDSYLAVATNAAIAQAQMK